MKIRRSNDDLISKIGFLHWWDDIIILKWLAFLVHVLQSYIRLSEVLALETRCDISLVESFLSLIGHNNHTMSTAASRQAMAWKCFCEGNLVVTCGFPTQSVSNSVLWGFLLSTWIIIGLLLIWNHMIFMWCYCIAHMQPKYFWGDIDTWKVNRYSSMEAIPHTSSLTYWGRDKMVAIFQMTFSNAFSWMKTYKF